ncbi:cytochrome P450 2K1-like isoform X1 [Mixophyes fleayi]|uniref:cytochrome P450 2K1-like isoform X1 n=1 Tax=Mixophyes fleayi TaxID=3061075 RepID=UPI003F4DDE8D
MTFITYLVSRVDVLLCLTACIALFIYWINGSKKKTGKMPPGPSPLPLIGNLNLMDLNKPYKSLMELSEKYGEVFTIHFGPKKVVILAGYKAVKDALVNQADDFGQRADIPIFKLLTKEMGLIFSHGELWKSTRRFTLSTLRDFGMGRKTIEARIQDELNPLVEKFKSHNGKPFATHTILNAAVSNVISSIIFGKRFEYDDPEFIKLIRLVIETTHLVGAPKLALYNCYPLIGTLLGAHKTVKKNIQGIIDVISEHVKNQRFKLDENDITGYIDAFLMKQKLESTKAETYFNDENLNYTVLDLFSAGSETTSTTLCWGILLMTKYPDIQKRVQEEIRTHIKAGQLPTVDDRRNMPYTDAVIHEIQRFANIVPLNLTHTTANDVYFRGYCIPKGTDVIPFLTSVLYDKTQWKTPNEFNPHHFLDAAGKFVRQDAFMPFSAGRRACVGESLAKMELFLFFTGLLQAFTFHQPTGVSRADLSLKPDIGFLLLPMPHLICAKLND